MINKQINTKQNNRKGKVVARRDCIAGAERGDERNRIMWTGGLEQWAISNAEIECGGGCRGRGGKVPD